MIQERWWMMNRIWNFGLLCSEDVAMDLGRALLLYDSCLETLRWCQPSVFVFFAVLSQPFTLTLSEYFESLVCALFVLKGQQIIFDVNECAGQTSIGRPQRSCSYVYKIGRPLKLVSLQIVGQLNGSRPTQYHLGMIYGLQDSMIWLLPYRLNIKHNTRKFLRWLRCVFWVFS